MKGKGGRSRGRWGWHLEASLTPAEGEWEGRVSDSGAVQRVFARPRDSLPS